MSTPQVTGARATGPSSISSWSNVGAVWVALVGFLLSAAVLEAVRAGEALALLVFAMVVAISAWFSTPVMGACIGVVGSMVVSRLVEAGGAGSSWAGWSAVLLFTSLSGLGVLASSAGPVTSRAAKRGRDITNGRPEAI